MNTICDGGTLLDPVLYQEADKILRSHLQTLTLLNNTQSDLHVYLTVDTPSSLLNNMMLILALLIFCLALCVLLATQPLPFLPRTRCWLRTIKQQPIDTETKIRQDVKPYQFPPLKEKTSTKMAMGLKRLDDSNWLTLDSAYLPEHTLRLQLLSSCQPNVVQMLPGSEPACHELLKIVTSFLSSRFPQHFTITSSPSGPEIVNRLTNEVYPIGPACANPLEVAAKLSMEDFNILVRRPETGEYHLQASATLFPAGWKLQERIGTSMANLHRPVPGWKQKLGHCVNRYFDHLSHKTAMERTNVFIQTTPDLFQDAPEPTPSSPATMSQLMVRRERQTFTRLQQTGAVLFTVRTYMEPLTQLGDAELKALRSQVLGWEADVRAYKGGDIWGPPLLRLCEERCGAVVVEVAKADERRS